MRFSAILMVVLLLSACTAREPATLHAESFTLENGLEVQLVPYTRAPVVTHMLWFRVGAAGEPEGVSGVAHYLEHMLFKGTENVADGEYTRRIERLGGEHNAFTGQDFTAYYVTIAKEHLSVVMELEADRMQFLDAEGYDSERDVIIEERRTRIDNRPSAMLAEKMDAELFAGHPYHIPIIGWPQDIAGLSKADVTDFYQTHYRPGNAVLVLVGDITLAEARELTERYYGSWQPVDVPERIWPDYVPSAVSEPITLHHPEVQQPVFRREYPAPSLKWGDTDRAFPLMLLADLLGDGRTSWLYQRLVKERQLAVSASASYNAFTLGPSSISVALSPAPGVSMGELTAAYKEELAAFLEQDIAPRALERVKNRQKAAAIYMRDGIQGQAYILGQLLMLGFDAGFFSSWADRLDAVTAETVKAAARITLDDTYAVTGHLLPQEEAL